MSSLNNSLNQSNQMTTSNRSHLAQDYVKAETRASTILAAINSILEANYDDMKFVYGDPAQVSIEIRTSVRRIQDALTLLENMRINDGY